MTERLAEAAAAETIRKRRSALEAGDACAACAEVLGIRVEEAAA